MKNIIILLFVSLVFKSLYAGNHVALCDEDKRKKMLCVKGQFIDYINVSFNDYKKNKSRTLKKIKYYNFSISDGDALIDITISFNYEHLKKDLHYSRKGGGGKYTIDKSDLSIKRRELYK